MNCLLSIRDLRTYFATDDGEARAVDDVSFDLYEGETLGIVGESGCGKTATALSILRLIEHPGRIMEGSKIRYAGRNLLLLKPRDLRAIRGAEISMIFQEPATSLNPVLTVGTQISETLRAHLDITRKDARDRAVELLSMVGIAEPEKRVRYYPHELSGGMQQRVMIAMALSCSPKILIADEPTTALDVTIQAQILDLLLELKQRLGMAMILITHDLGIVAGVADRVAVMYAGRLVEHAPTKRLFESPEHPYTRALLRAIPRLDQPVDRLAVIPGSVPPATDWPPACRFHPRCSRAWELCSSKEPELESIDPGHQSRCWLAQRAEP
ncbi:MAG: ABC transporter ATP-binding protein [Gemmatimonadales bacterium]